jgi:uncharacterized protein (TIGR03435 family)
MPTMIRTIAIPLCGALFCSAAFGQAAAPPLSFEVADIQVSKAGGPEPSAQFLPGGRVDLRRITLKEMVAAAYKVDDDMVAGGPNWLGSDQFDVVAKAEPKSSDDQLRLMLQNMLAARFKLVVHQDKKVVPVYALVVGKGGPKLRESEAGDSVQKGCKRENPNEPNRLGIRIACTRMTMADLAEELPNRAGAYIDLPMVDLTRLKGAYEFKLVWTPKAALEGRKAADGTVITEPAGGLSVFDALQAQLGLKLEQRKIPMPLIVIDRVERVPTDR